MNERALDLPALLGNLPAVQRLANAGILTVDALLALRPSELRKRHGVGKGTAALAIERIAAHGLTMAKDPPSKPGPDPAEEARCRSATDAFAAAWKAAHPGAEHGYPWSLGKDGRERRLRGPLADTADLDRSNPRSVERLRRAAEHYIREAEAGRAFPFGEAPTFPAFCRDAAKWLQVADGAPIPRARGSPRRSDADDRADTLEAIRLARERLALEPDHADP
jgi:hypothetical protein